MQELIFLTQRIPYPPMKGEKIRPLQILRYLRQHYVVHLGCLIDDPADWQYTGVLRELCGETYFAKLNPRLAKLACLRGLLSSVPLSVPYFYDRGLAAWVTDLLARRRPDAAFVCSSAMAQYLLGQPHRPPRVVMDFADVDSDKWRQYAGTRSWPMSWICARESRTLLEFDRRVGRAFDASVFVSRAEAELFSRLAPEVAGKTHYVNSGVDAAYFSPDAVHENPYDGRGPVVVFTGTMSYWPNIDAVTWFAEEVMPRLRGWLPGLRFCIVGSSPAPQVQRLADLAGVTVTGRVADVRPYVAHAAVAVAPLRIANGVQNKVLEAMAMAKIVVASPRALAGVDPEAARNVLVAEDPESFAETVRGAIVDGSVADLGCNLPRDETSDGKIPLPQNSSAGNLSMQSMSRGSGNRPPLFCPLIYRAKATRSESRYL
jgi:sugar transferase (PEP-CTERM/EpsH1 system associated)